MAQPSRDFRMAAKAPAQQGFFARQYDKAVMEMTDLRIIGKLTVQERLANANGLKKWFPKVVSTSGSQKRSQKMVPNNGLNEWFSKMISENGSPKWSQTVVPKNGLEKWFPKMVSKMVPQNSLKKWFPTVVSKNGPRKWSQKMVPKNGLGKWFPRMEKWFPETVSKKWFPKMVPTMPAHGDTATLCAHGRDNPTFVGYAEVARERLPHYRKV